MTKEILVLGVSPDLKVIQLWTSLRMQWSTRDPGDICSSSTDDRSSVQCESNYSIPCQDSSVSKVCNIYADTSLSKLSEKIILINCPSQAGSRATSILLSTTQNRLLVMKALLNNNLLYWRMLRRQRR